MIMQAACVLKSISIRFVLSVAGKYRFALLCLN